MSGNIVFTDNGRIYGNKNSEWEELILSSDTDQKSGAFIAIRGVDSPTDPGSIAIVTRKTDETTGPMLNCDVSGTLRWNGSEVLTVVEK